jgi:hypothetical protein
VIQQQNADGTWSEAVPIPPTRILRWENKLRAKGYLRLANILARWDERGLGR